MGGRKKVVVAHHLWSRVGGGELVNAYAVKTLLDAGHDVVVVSTSRFDKGRYGEWFGIDLGDAKMYALLPKPLPLFGIYQRLLFHMPLRKAIEKENPDVVFVDNELYKPVLKLKDAKGFRLLEYIHFPFHVFLFEGNVPEGYREAFERYASDARLYHKKYEDGLWKLYFRLWLRLYKVLVRDNPFEATDVVMTNSKYIANLIKTLWGGDAVVLYPPVKVRDFEASGGKPFEGRDDAVVMVGRITPEKGYEQVIKAVARTKSKPILRIIGGLIPSNIPYKERIEKLAKDEGVRLELYVNIPRGDLVRLVTSSKVFVHATVGEHFGIAVVEGMAAGCPVIVHRSGGPYEDIIDRGSYGMYFETVDELAERIDRLVTDGNAWRHYHRLSLVRSREFDEGRFAEGLLKVLDGG